MQRKPLGKSSEGLYCVQGHLRAIFAVTANAFVFPLT